MKEEAVLLIGRGHAFPEYIQGMINIFQNKYTVLVYDGNLEITFSGNHIRQPLIEKSKFANFELYDKVKRVEKETGLNLYESYSNYFYYGRLAEEAKIRSTSYWKSKRDLATEYLGAYDFMTRILSKYDLKFCYHDTIDMILLQMIEAFSKLNNFGFYHTLIRQGVFDERALLTCGIKRKSPIFIKELQNNAEAKEKEYVEKKILSFREEKPIPKYLSEKSNSIITFNEIKRIPSRIKNLKYGFNRIINRQYLNSATKNFDLESTKDYILFFLHHQPESTTTSAAAKYVDQWKIIEDIAANAPSDLNIVIKGHPWSFGWQGKDYFEKMVRLPNVHLAPVYYPGKELITNAKLVLTINGSVGLEALLYDTPIYTLGDPWYSVPGYIENMDTPLDVINVWENPKTISHETKVKFLAAVYRASIYCTNMTDQKYQKEMLASGESIAEHVLQHKDIYFKKVIL